MSSTGPLQQNAKCSGGKCDLLEYDDSKCAGVCKGCVGIPGYGLSNKCTSACRKCRNFGTTWEPRRPMTPLPYTDMYNDYPGYATTGDFVEHFGMSDVTSNPMYLFIVVVGILYAAAQTGSISYSSPMNLAMWAAIITVAITLLKKY
jgi:hypothetical protein